MYTLRLTSSFLRLACSGRRRIRGDGRGARVPWATLAKRARTAHRPTAAEPGELADHSPTRRIRKRSITNVRRGPPHQFTTWQTDATSTPEPNMKFMILVKSKPDLEARLAAMSDSQMKEQMAAMGVFNE